MLKDEITNRKEDLESERKDTHQKFTEIIT